MFFKCLASLAYEKSSKNRYRKLNFMTLVSGRQGVAFPCYITVSGEQHILDVCQSVSEIGVFHTGKVDCKNIFK